MNSAPQLLREDRPEFERVLDEALRTAHHQHGFTALGKRLNTEQLRTMALSAAVPIAACAAAEYERFVELREELRGPSHAPSSSGGAQHHPGPAGRDPTTAAERPEGSGLGLAGAMGEGLAETAGAGLVAVVSVLAPLLAGAAAVIFLLVGYALHMLTPEPALAEPMRNAGWVFTALAAGTALLGMGGLLLAAVRNGSRAIGVQQPAGGGLAEEVTRARAAWRDALLERGILPFLREALADPQGARETPGAYVPDEHRTPRLGYSHPDFSSPAAGGPGETATRPRFSSPDFSSPDYGGPDHAPE